MCCPVTKKARNIETLTSFTIIFADIEHADLNATYFTFLHSYFCDCQEFVINHRNLAADALPCLVPDVIQH